MDEFSEFLNRQIKEAADLYGAKDDKLLRAIANLAFQEGIGEGQDRMKKILT
jgi:hypothetical protein